MTNIVPLHSNISDSLRKLADEIDSGKYPNLKGIVAAFIERRSFIMEVRNWGQISGLEIPGALSAASHFTIKNEAGYTQE